jgi:hypothetical protein
LPSVSSLGVQEPDHLLDPPPPLVQKLGESFCCVPPSLRSPAAPFSSVPL